MPGNMVRGADDIPGAIEKARGLEGLRAVVIIVGDKVGVWGNAKLVAPE